MLQYWNNYDDLSLTQIKEAIKNTIDGKNDENFNGGHSVIFKSYIKNISGEVIGIKYYDYSGINRSYSFDDGGKIFLGANLKDIIE